MSSVIQEWVTGLSWKEQSVLMAAVRGPDNPGPECKKLTRWIRGLVLQNADPSHTFMLPTEGIGNMYGKDLWAELEYQPLHYVMHLIHALEVLAYNDANETISATGPAPLSRQAMYWTAPLYRYLVVECMHLNCESREEMRERLKDRVGMATH